MGYRDDYGFGDVVWQQNEGNGPLPARTGLGGGFPVFEQDRVLRMSMFLSRNNADLSSVDLSIDIKETATGNWTNFHLQSYVVPPTNNPARFDINLNYDVTFDGEIAMSFMAGTITGNNRFLYIRAGLEVERR